MLQGRRRVGLGRRADEWGEAGGEAAGGEAAEAAAAAAATVPQAISTRHVQLDGLHRKPRAHPRRLQAPPRPTARPPPCFTALPSPSLVSTDPLVCAALWDAFGSVQDAGTPRAAHCSSRRGCLRPLQGVSSMQTALTSDPGPSGGCHMAGRLHSRRSTAWRRSPVPQPHCRASLCPSLAPSLALTIRRIY